MVFTPLFGIFCMISCRNYCQKQPFYKRFLRKYACFLAKKLHFCPLLMSLPPPGNVSSDSVSAKMLGENVAFNEKLHKFAGWNGLGCFTLFLSYHYVCCA